MEKKHQGIPQAVLDKAKELGASKVKFGCMYNGGVIYELDYKSPNANKPDIIFWTDGLALPVTPHGVH